MLPNDALPRNKLLPETYAKPPDPHVVYRDLAGRPRTDLQGPLADPSLRSAANKKNSNGSAQPFKIPKKTDAQPPVRLASFQLETKYTRTDPQADVAADVVSDRASRDAHMPRPMTPFAFGRPASAGAFQIPSLSMRDYYRDSKLFECVTAGLVQVGKERPENAVEYLGQFLLEQARLHEKKQ